MMKLTRRIKNKMGFFFRPERVQFREVVAEVYALPVGESADSFVRAAEAAYDKAAWRTNVKAV